MRFIVFLATFLVLSVSASAQRGGGHASFGGGHVASRPNAGAGFTSHVGAAFPWSPGGPAGARNPWAATGSYGRTGRTGNFGRMGRDRDGFAGRGTHRYYGEIPYLWGLYSNYYDPFGDSGYYDQPNYYGQSPDYGQYQEPNPYDSGYGQDPQTAYLTAQIQQLSNQLNAAEQQGVQPPAAPQTAPAAAPAVPITLVLKDGRHLQVQNYAVMDHTFWDFTSQPVKKIPLTDIDIAASQQLSVANGAEFPNLTASSGTGQ